MNPGRVNSKGFARLLADFLRIVPQTIPDLETAPWHLGFPTGGPVLVGSDLGRDVWDAPEGQRLVEYVLTDLARQQWFAPPPESFLAEIRFCLASVVEQFANSGAPVEEFAAERASDILDSMRASEAVCTGVCSVYGIGLDQGDAELPYGLSIEPATADTLRTILPRLGASLADLIRRPNLPGLLLLCRTSVSRAEWRGLAAGTAAAACRIELDRLRTAIWLASGVLPAWSDMWVFHESAYPAVPFQRISPTPEQRFPGESGFSAGVLLDSGFLSEVLVRIGAISGMTEPHLTGEAIDALWVAQGIYLRLALEVADTPTAVLMAYAAMDGLLLNEKEDESLLISRVGCLIGRSYADRRAVRRLVDRLQRIRGAVAHGKRARLADAAAAVGRHVSLEELAEKGIFADRELNVVLRGRCLDVLRRVLVSFLWLTVEGQPWSGGSDRPRAELGLSRQEVLETLDRAHRADKEALGLLEAKIPAVVRGGVAP